LGAPDFSLMVPLMARDRRGAALETLPRGAAPQLSYEST